VSLTIKSALCFCWGLDWIGSWLMVCSVCSLFYCCLLLFHSLKQAIKKQKQLAAAAAAP
jgi:hypothetical protein